ncbi:LOW QUALITY PROTEIN: protein phosphatase 1 regulatory subunit 15B-like [Periophthalmus magnuspinnatus]|uniref:LOW QUALITY PROTEIN: protein phosphatase 1 regulatory subunit 15B-like n=1 Tax=Periophthalmus magnuspinnatus TaxID=409849 RepID=UPI0024370A64|nr:LOW QUALITY PROTEIN: protein phosphatase 1 regulatory subunit 15B-like [Periophthalmus magnuspinnatus]
MWRTVTGERTRRQSGTSVSSPPGPELTSPGFLTHDSPLLGLLSAVSRPAVSFLQRYLPGRPVKRDFLEPDRELLRRFDDILSPPPPQQLHSLPWFNLSELAIQSPEDMSPQTGFLGSGPAVENHVLMPGPGSVSKTWWGGLWSDAEEEQVRCSSVTLCTENRTVTFIQERSEISSTSTDKGAFSSGLPSLPRLALFQNLGVRGDISVLTPDQDHGYSSLEEEQQLVAKARLQSALPGMGSAEEPRDEPEPRETEEELPVLKCENKTIAFIMGCPCSDDSGSDSSEEEEEEEEDEDDDDDGFDSVCSSEVSGSEEDDEEFDSETERLWSTLCQSDDPYNPRNFTAKLGSAPRPIPRTGLGPKEDESSPGSCASSLASSASSSPFASSSSWDEASDAEEQNLKLLSSFCSSDPYSPLNFQAPIRTKARAGTKPGPRRNLRSRESKRFLSVPRAAHKATIKKKVQFCLEVQVYSVGLEERRGQWEELARDRARFLKRCRDVEQVLCPCLQPEHRRRVCQRISQSEARAESEGHTSQPESVRARGEGHGPFTEIELSL